MRRVPTSRQGVPYRGASGPRVHTPYPACPHLLHAPPLLKPKRARRGYTTHRQESPVARAPDRQLAGARAAWMPFPTLDTRCQIGAHEMKTKRTRTTGRNITTIALSATLATAGLGLASAGIAWAEEPAQDPAAAVSETADPAATSEPTETPAESASQTPAESTSETTQPTQTSETPAPAETSTTITPITDVQVVTIELTNDVTTATTLYDQINAVRAEQGLPALTRSVALEDARLAARRGERRARRSRPARRHRRVCREPLGRHNRRDAARRRRHDGRHRAGGDHRLAGGRRRLGRPALLGARLGGHRPGARRGRHLPLGGCVRRHRRRPGRGHRAR